MLFQGGSYFPAAFGCDALQQHEQTAVLEGQPGESQLVFRTHTPISACQSQHIHERNRGAHCEVDRETTHLPSVCTVGCQTEVAFAPGICVTFKQSKTQEGEHINMTVSGRYGTHLHLTVNRVSLFL